MEWQASTAPDERRVQIYLPPMHTGQQVVWDHMQRHTILDAGRRWRKTTLAMRKSIMAAIQGERIVWGAPTYKQVDIGWNEARRAVEGVFTFRTTKMEAISPTGGIVTYRSLDDPNNARGLSADGIVIDEAADVSEEAWYEVLHPMLIDTGGWSLFLGTPKGHNWFWREYEHARDRENSIAFTAPTKGAQVIDGQLVRVPHPLENPDIPWEEIVEIFNTTPERTFRQEILAEFLENAGGVVRGVRDAVGGRLEAGPSLPATEYIMGVDFAKHNDFTVCVVIDRLRRQVVDFQRWNQADWPLQERRVCEIAAKWNNALVWADETGLGGPILDHLRRMGIRICGYTFTQNSKRELIDNMVLLVEQRQVHYPDIPVLISELSSYEYERLPGGGLRMNAPSGMHDDCVIAFALACWPLARTSSPITLDMIEAISSPTGMTGLNARRLWNTQL
jgi:hypothetical protein